LFSSGDKGKGHAQDLFHVRSLTVSPISATEPRTVETTADR
jgi:hypothetical protein